MPKTSFSDASLKINALSDRFPAEYAEMLSHRRKFIESYERWLNSLPRTQLGAQAARDEADGIYNALDGFRLAWVRAS